MFTLSPEFLLFSGRANRAFAEKVAQSLSVELGRLKVLEFADGELSVDIEHNVRGRDVFIIQSTARPVNDHLVELLIIIDALRRSSAGRITAVMPYFGYARQDRKTKPRVPITAKLVANLVTTAGADRLLSMDLHSGQIMGFFDIPVDNLNALPIVVRYFQEKYQGQEMMAISPDAGGVERARLFATKMGNVPLAVIDKRRAGPNQVAEMVVVGDVRGKTCVIVDDMIDTGGTLTKAAESLLEAGARRILACCTHGIFSGACKEKIAGSVIEELVITDTIAPMEGLPPQVTVLSVASLVAEAIARIHQDDSISSLFL